MQTMSYVFSLLFISSCYMSRAHLISFQKVGELTGDFTAILQDDWRFGYDVNLIGNIIHCITSVVSVLL